MVRPIKAFADAITSRGIKVIDAVVEGYIQHLSRLILLGKGQLIANLGQPCPQAANLQAGVAQDSLFHYRASFQAVLCWYVRLPRAQNAL
jgi:hypothetical protein